LGRVAGRQLAEKAMRAAPHDQSYADTAGFICLKKKMPEAALQTLRNVARNSPDNPTYMYHLAFAELDSGRADEARATLTAALGKKPSKSESAQIHQALQPNRPLAAVLRAGKQKNVHKSWIARRSKPKGTQPAASFS
jgi:predicted Zn-dependent protease